MRRRRASRTILALTFTLVFSSQAIGQVVDGRTGPGSLYRLIRPANWNGTLLVYAHGFVSPEQPVSLPPDAVLIASLVVPQGVAVAISSYSENGWSVKDGAQRTFQLLGLFTSKFGAPNRVYIAGASMGGLIAVKLVETHPDRFVGALPACALVGGMQRQFDYWGHVRALFDVFYRGVLPGNVAAVPPGIDVNQAIVAPAIAAMTANPSGAAAIASISQTPVPFASGAELIQSIATALGGHATSYPDLLEFTHGHAFFDNTATVYTGSLPPAVLGAVNADVVRYAADPSAINYLEHYYEPSGDIQVPTLTLRTSRDPVIPGFHQLAFGATVAAAGQSDLLVQRTVDRYGHCDSFLPVELAQAFSDLVLWAEHGIKPAP
jgi:pimeloyl-ACP methyl ester carboxylesterase